MEIKDLKTIEKRPPQTSDIIPSVNEFQKWERILNGVNDLLVNFMKIKGGGEPQGFNGDNINNRSILSNETSGHIGAYNPPLPNNQNKPIIPLEIQMFLQQHISKCYEENNEMPFSEIIDKIPLNATNLLMLIQALKGSK